MVDGVIDGSGPAVCKWVRLMRARHARDLKTGGKRGLWFDAEAGERVVQFFEHYCIHTSGEWGRQRAPFILAPWQAEITRILFGWMKLPTAMTARHARNMPFDKRRSAGIFRRFRQAYIEVARKNGKSTWMAALCLYMAGCDREMGAEVYSAATKRDQAKRVWLPAKRMIKNSAKLRRFFRVQDSISRITVPTLSSVFEPLSQDAKTSDGLDSHFNVIDEYHAHKTAAMFDVLTTGEGSREQPMTVVITTAGLNHVCPCYVEHQLAKQILEGTLDNDSYFAVIFTLDDGDNWRDPAVWVKANPGLGITPKLDYLERQVKRAMQSAPYMNTVKVKHFNIWSRVGTRFFPLDKWDAQSGKSEFAMKKGETPFEWRSRMLERLGGCECVGGLDLGSVSDFTAFALVFRQTADSGYPLFVVLPWFWMPREATSDREQRLRDSYDEWAVAGFLEWTDGDAVDYDLVRNNIKETANKFGIQELAIDRQFQGAQLSQQLLNDEGFNVAAYSQGYGGFAAPTKEILELVLNGRLMHGGNPILRWMASNTEVKTDHGGRMMPCKPVNENPFKIDGIVATIMALGRLITQEETTSMYETQEVVTVEVGP